MTARRQVRWVRAVASMLNQRRTMIDTARIKPTAITTATAPSNDCRETPSPSSPGTITSSVMRPMTTVKPTTARANTLAPMIPAPWAHGCIRRDRQTSRPPRRSTLSGTACPTRVVVSLRAGRSESVDNGRGELRALHLGGPVHQSSKVVGHDLVGHRRLHGPDDVVCRVLPSDVLEHENA